MRDFLNNNANLIRGQEEITKYLQNLINKYEPPEIKTLRTEGRKAIKEEPETSLKDILKRLLSGSTAVVRESIKLNQQFTGVYTDIVTKALSSMGIQDSAAQKRIQEFKELQPLEQRQILLILEPQPPQVSIEKKQ